MKTTITFERLMPTTADGELIKVTTLYSSFDKEEIDNLQKDLQKSIGAGITMLETENDDKCVGCYWNYNGFCTCQGLRPCNYEEAKDE